MLLTQEKLATMSREQKIEAGLRLKLRFTSEVAGGRYSIEDLYDLALSSTRKPSLDAIAIELNRQIKEAGELSFVKKNKVDVKVQLAFDIVTGIIEARMAEDEAAKSASLIKEKEQKLMEQLDRIERRELDEKSGDEVRAELAALRAKSAPNA